MVNVYGVIRKAPNVEVAFDLNLKKFKDLIFKAIKKLDLEQSNKISYDLKKDNLTKLYTYISRNRQGIINQVKLKDKEIERAIESNISQLKWEMG